MDVSSLLFRLVGLPLTLLAPFGCLGLLLWWVQWLRRKTSAPSIASRVAYALLLLGTALMVLVPLASAVYAALRPSGLVTGAGPSQKSRALAEGISGAMNDVALVWIAAVTATTLWLVFATWRWHWSVRPESRTAAPAYR